MVPPAWAKARQLAIYPAGQDPTKARVLIVTVLAK
eukprot:CAMPEP_0171491510 /NCGR_PEP_ID=MMETSP0958-20121227/3898_1 /TAXON_ID=87120 /ORGANISM="Aurantiochytrium limacinum, Strain ATCCMYA-1381" /LENGTH=34 /DNA_ID= /DNA_START= /DNA_END= /DNA_ORIENTATION=